MQKDYKDTVDAKDDRYSIQDTVTIIIKEDPVDSKNDDTKFLTLSDTSLLSSVKVQHDDAGSNVNKLKFAPCINDNHLTKPVVGKNDSNESTSLLSPVKPIEEKIR